MINLLKDFFGYILDKCLRHRNLKFDILSSFFVLQIITAVSIISYTYISNTRTLFEFSNRLMENISDSEIAHIAGEFKDVLISTEIGSYLVKDTSKEGILNKELIQFMMGHVNQYKLVDSVYVATESGYFVQIKPLQFGDTYRVSTERVLPNKVSYALRILDRSSQKPTETWIYLDNDGKKIDQENVPESQITMIPKNRPWYKKAEQTRSKSWTDIFVSDANKESSIACSVPLLSNNGEFEGVISSSVSLKKLADVLKKNTLKGACLVINKKGEIVSHPTQETFSKNVAGDTKLITVDDLHDNSIASAYHNKPMQVNPRFIFTVDKTKYIALFKEFSLEGFKDWDFLMVTPLDEFIGGVKITQRNNFLICLFILILSTILIAFIARRIAEPINNLSEQADKITNFDLNEETEVKSGIREIQKLQNSISRMRKSLISFGKFVPKNLVKKLVDKGIEVRIGGKKKQLTILFSDIANFTTISESYPAEKLVQHLYEYFDEMTTIISEHNGTVDKYIGDSIMAFWGSPQQDNHHYLNCCLSALLCQRRLIDLNKKWAYEKKPTFTTRIGIHTGDVIVGNMGSSERMNYTLIGDSVNLASRLEGTNKIYGTSIIVSDTTVKQLYEHAVVRPLDIVAVKGKNEGITIYELIALKNSDPVVLPTDNQLKFCEEFSKAFRYYLEQRWDESLKIFKELQLTYGKDQPCEMYISRCKAFKENPPPADWDGVFHLDKK